MKKPLALLASMTLLLLGCASSDSDEPPVPSRGGRMPEGMNGPARGAPPDLDIIPLTDWWHEPQVTASLNLTTDQYASLDRIAGEQQDEITRLERARTTAMRDLRNAFDTDPDGVATAAQRVRSLHDTLFDRQVQMLTAERRVLHDPQWRALKEALQQQRSERRGDRNDRRGGRGGMRGRGRWPGF